MTWPSILVAVMSALSGGGTVADVVAKAGVHKPGGYPDFALFCALETALALGLVEPVDPGAA